MSVPRCLNGIEEDIERAQQINAHDNVFLEPAANNGRDVTGINGGNRCLYIAHIHRLKKQPHAPSERKQTSGPFR